MAKGLNRTKIAWVANPDGSTPGWSWNPITSCLTGCEYCYARALAEGRMRERYLTNKDVMLPSADAVQIRQPGTNENFFGDEFTDDPFTWVTLPDHTKDPFWPRWWHDRQYAPFNQKKSSGIFTVNMGDLFGPWVADRYVTAVLHAVRGLARHRFYLLTKYPDRYVDFDPWPPNAWLGATATDFESFLGAALHLGGADAAVRYISLEPLLDWPDRSYVDLVDNLCIDTYAQVMAANDVSWLIVGPLNWKIIERQDYHQLFQSSLLGLRLACDRAGVALFEKPECSRYMTGELRQEWPDER